MAVARSTKLLGLLFVLGAVAAACGSDAEPVTAAAPSPPPAATQGPVTSTVADLADATLTVSDVVDSGPQATATGAGWVQLPDSPLTPRVGASVISAGNEVLVFGGSGQLCRGFCTLPTPTLNDGAALDMISLTWRPLPDIPTGRPWSGPVVVDGDIYVGASCDDGTGCATEGRLLRLRVQANQWDELPAPSDSGFVLSAVGGRLVASTGGGEGGSGWAEYVFDAVTDTWTLLPADPLPRNEDRFVVDLNGELGVFASRRPSLEEVGVAFDFDTWQWRELSPSGRQGYQMWVVDGLGYLATHGDAAIGGVYDPAKDTWASLPDPPSSPNWDPFLDGVMGAETLALGGDPARWILDAVAGEWVAVQPMPVPGGSTFGSQTNWGTSIFVFGGSRSVGEDDVVPGPAELLNEAWLWTKP